MLASLGRKSKEDEEDKRADDARPLGQGVRSRYAAVHSPDDCWNLSDTTEIIVSVFPADPRGDRGGGCVHGN